MSLSQSQSSTTTDRATFIGLSIAWGGTAMLVGPLGRALGNPDAVRTQLLSQLALWLLLAAVLLVVRFGERQPLSSLWFKRLTWRSVGWAAVVVPIYLFILFPATEAVRTAIGVEGYAGGMQRALAIPFWLRVFAVLTAGVVEEVLFRGYAVTRLMRLFGHPVSATIVSSAAFAVLHLPMWGPGPTLSFFIASAAMTAFFIWRRDLWTMIIAHILIDGWALVVSPAFSNWWTTMC